MRIANNPKLTTVDLHPVERLDYLDIRSNPELKEVRMPLLEGVDALLVLDNPSLATSAFSNLKTFSTEMSGNLDDSAPDAD